MDKIKSWVINHKIEFIILVLILFIGAFLRLYKINEYMTFLGDEGRDVIVVRRLLTELHPPLIGPGTSIGNMYLGPAYYYMMAIPLLLANFNPVGPAIFIALLGVATIFFLWFVVQEWFPTNKINFGALIAAFLYAISPVIIIYSRSSWNPNIMPFFATLCIYSIWKVWQSREASCEAGCWLIVTAISFACVLQSHYLGLLLLPVILIIWILKLISNLKFKIKNYLIYSFTGLLVFIILMSPLVIFDFRHGWHNFAAIKEFFTVRQETVSIKPWNALPLIPPIFVQISTDLVAAKNLLVGQIVAGLTALFLGFLYFIKREKYDARKVSIIVTISLWLGFALLGLGLYKQHIYDHYFGFIFTAPFIVIGGIFQHLKKSSWSVAVGSLVVLILVFVDFQKLPLNSPPNKQLERAQTVTKKVEEIAAGQRFNFALIADNNYDSAYRYFLNLRNAKVVDIDPQNTKDTVTNQLIVVCERVKEKCDPTHNPKTEISHWGWSKVETEYDNVFGVTIYLLAHTQ